MARRRRREEQPSLELGTWYGKPMYLVRVLRRATPTNTLDPAEAEAFLATFKARLAEPVLADTGIADVCEWAKTGLGYKASFSKVRADWGARSVSAVDQASIDKYLSTGGSLYAARILVRAIDRYAKDRNMAGAPVVRFKAVRPRESDSDLTKTEVARLLWACLGYRWDDRRMRMLRIPDEDERKAVRLKRRPIGRLLLLTVYTGLGSACLRNLLWHGATTGDASFVELPPAHRLAKLGWPLPHIGRRLHRLGEDTPVVDKLRGIPVTLSIRITAHLLRWRRLDGRRFAHVVHGRQQGRYCESTLAPNYAAVVADAGLGKLSAQDLAATFAALALTQGAYLRDVGIAMGIAFDTAERLYRHFAVDFQQGIVNASRRRPPTSLR